MEHRILIIARHRLFAEGLASLLRATGDARVVGIIDSTYALGDAITKLGPDIIVVEGDACEALSMLGDCPGMRVVVVTLDASTIDVYDTVHISRAGGEDLLRVIGSNVNN